jgi:hypothetical protein
VLSLSHTLIHSRRKIVGGSSDADDDGKNVKLLDELFSMYLLMQVKYVLFFSDADVWLIFFFN